MRRTWWQAAVVAALALVGCAPEPADPGGCVPGMSIECACALGARGFQVCQPDRTYGACDCRSDGGTAPDADLPDTGRGDVGRDATVDASLDDTAPVDVAPRDTGAMDAVSPEDVGALDTGLVDAGPGDTGASAIDVVDAGTPDAGRPDTGLDVGPACVAPHVVCGGVCVDPTSDVAHCGACGRVCAAFPGATATCAAGACSFACAAGRGNCDGVSGNGCETDTTTSIAHCGACGRRCAAPANATPVCVAGACGFVCNAGYARSGAACVAAPMDAGADTGVPDTGVPDTGVPDSGVTTAAPYRAERCEVWAQVPPAVTYASVFESGGALWAAGQGILARRSAERWSLDRTPVPDLEIDLDSSQRARTAWPVAGSVVAMETRGTTRRLYFRRDGRWEDVTPPELATGPLNATSSGTELLVEGTVGLFAFDGRAWSRLAGARATSALGPLWGERTALYAYAEWWNASGTLTRFDGATWTRVTTADGLAPIAVGGPSRDEVYVVTVARRGEYHLHRVTGATTVRVAAPWDALTCETVPYGPDDYDRYGAWLLLAAAPGQAVLTRRCARRALRVWRLRAGAWEALPDPDLAQAYSGTALVEAGYGGIGYVAARVEASGVTYLASANGAVYRFAGGAWQLLLDQPAPPAEVLTVNDAGDAYVAGRDAVARLVAGRWTPVPAPGLTGHVIHGVWLAPEGTLFVAAREVATGAVALWRYASGRWVRDTPAAAGPYTQGTHLHGRSERDVYLATGLGLHHWDGTRWTATGVPFGPFALYGANRALAVADRTLYEFNGTTWTATTTGTSRPVLGQLGPPASPAAVFDGRLYTAAGVGPFRVPVGLALEAVFGPSPASVFAFGLDGRTRYTYGRTDGATPWTTLGTDWAFEYANPAPGYYGDLATNRGASSRAVYFTARFGGYDPAGRSVFRCDLGP